MKRLLVVVALLASPLLLPSAASATHPCAQPAGGGSPVGNDPYSGHDGCPPAPLEAEPGDVGVQADDDGRTVVVARGARLVVDLAAEGARSWDDVTAGPALHRTRLRVDGYSTTAVFRALAPTDGEVVRAQRNPFCPVQGDACGPPTWSVTVVVPDGPEPSPRPAPACTPGTAPPARDDVVEVDADAATRTVRVRQGDLLAVWSRGCGEDDLPPATGGPGLFRFRALGPAGTGSLSVLRAGRLGPSAVTVGDRTWPVEVVERCDAVGSTATPAGYDVPLSGRVRPGATVQVWFRPAGATAFTVRRTLTADEGGSWSTSFRPVVDHRWYATSTRSDGSACTSPAGLTQVQPVLRVPAEVRRGGTAAVTVLGPAGQPVQLRLHGTGSAPRVVRSGRLDARGRYVVRLPVTRDLRLSAVTGPDRRTTFATELVRAT